MLTQFPGWFIVATLIAFDAHQRAWGAGPGSSGETVGAAGLQSLERVPMAEIFFQAKQSSGAGRPGVSPGAIVGEGFFQILMPGGAPAYTRSDNFKLTSDGLIVTRDGLWILGGLPPIPSETTGVIVAASGAILLATPSGSVAAGRITLVRFSNPAGLKPIGSDILLESEASGPPETGNPGENGFGEIGPGFLRLPGSFGFTTQLGAARSWIDVEVSLDARTWTALASVVSSNGERLFVRDLRAADFARRFYRVRSRPFPFPPSGQ
ncbi:MAG: hypothetical protein HYY23_13395 [Verrucomicrobia bacterium]|nr:hypothetical protein [Verrucomicrobiota bacterium]